MYDIKTTESENIEVFLEEILGATEEVEERFLRRAADVVKRNVVKQLNTLRTSNNKEDYKHMADDVIYRVVKDRYGGKVARVRGGQRTGTKWHLVNDGTYRTSATHFLDLALQESDDEVRRIFDEEMTKEGF